MKYVCSEAADAGMKSNELIVVFVVFSLRVCMDTFFWGVVCSLQLSLISPQHMETTLQCTGVFAESC